MLNVVGERVGLGPLRRELIPLLCRWSNDLGTSRTLGLSWPQTIEQTTAEYERRAKSEDEAWFTIYELATEKPIGTADLYQIEPRHGRANFGIVIGEADCRGKGYGTEATRLVLDYAFTALGLTNVMLTVFAFNVGGRRAYERAGFREFGRRRTCSRLGGRLWDLIYMECVAEEFTSPVLSRIFLPDQERP